VARVGVTDARQPTGSAAAARRGRGLAALLRAGIGPRAAAGERGSAPYRAAPEPCPALGRPSPVRTKHYTPGPGSACRPGAVTTRGPRASAHRARRRCPVIPRPVPSLREGTAST